MILRRAPFGIQVVDKTDLDTEAAIMRAAENAGVPSPHVHYVPTPEDGFGHPRSTAILVDSGTLLEVVPARCARWHSN